MINEVGLLEKVKSKIESPDKLCREEWSQDKDGFYIHWAAKDVAKCCVMAWLRRVVLEETGQNVVTDCTDLVWKTYRNAIDLLTTSIPNDAEQRSVVTYQDKAGHSDVLKMVDTAIETAKGNHNDKRS